MSEGFNPNESFEKYGYTFSGFFDAVRQGFLRAYDEGQSSGFNPDGPLQDGSKERVLAVLQAIEDQYGKVDLKPLGSLATVSALGLFQALNDVLHGFESFSNAKPEDFDKARMLAAASKAASNADYYSGQPN